MAGFFVPLGIATLLGYPQKHSRKRAPSETEEMEHEIAATDAEIDNLVYELYGITDEERKIIEGAEDRCYKLLRAYRQPLLL